MLTRDNNILDLYNILKVNVLLMLQLVFYFDYGIRSNFKVSDPDSELGKNEGGGSEKNSPPLTWGNVRHLGDECTHRIWPPTPLPFHSQIQQAGVLN